MYNSITERLTRLRKFMQVVVLLWRIMGFGLETDLYIGPTILSADI